MGSDVLFKSFSVSTARFQVSVPVVHSCSGFVQGWEEFYPGGVLPEGGKQECTPEYFFKVLLMFVFIFAFAGALGYFLERMPEMLPKYNTIEPS